MWIGSGPRTSSTNWKRNRPREEYTRGQPSDQKAQKVTLLSDIVEKGNEGNHAIINYDNREGWLLYKTLSNKYSKEIMETVPK